MATEGFRPAGLEADYLILPVAWARSAEVVLDHLARSPADGVLMFGVAVDADAFRVETFAHNRAAPLRVDDDGECWPAACVAEQGAASHPVTAPGESMLAALVREGLPARSSDDAGDYLCNFVLYRLLAACASPAVGFLHVPQARELAPGAAASLHDIDRGARAAAAGFAAALRSAAGPTSKS